MKPEHDTRQTSRDRSSHDASIPSGVLRRRARPRLRSGLLLAAGLLIPCGGSAQEAPNTAAAVTDASSRVDRRPRAATNRVLEAHAPDAPPPRVDGRLDDEAWAAARPASEFVQFRPNPGAPASEATTVRVVYTASDLYVAAHLRDSRPEDILKRLARRDERTAADRFRVGLDSYFDRRTAFVFEVNAAGVQRDWLQYDDTRQDDGWNAVWESATRTTEDGWTVEMRIPLSQLRFESPSSAGAEFSWGVNFQRDIARLDETSTWAPRPADGSRDVSAFGTLVGLRGLEPGRSFEVRPYLLARATRAPGSTDDPFYSPTDLAPTIGADLRYGLTSNLTLNVTLNPDFGQVEADPASVNLSAFETFLPERRPFFQEGSDIFQFGLGGGGWGGGEQLFYSRRIGRRPQGRAPSEAAFSDLPDATTILGAAKLSGKTSDGWSLGLLTALTGTEQARYVTSTAPEATSLVEPMTSYGVGRAIRNFRGGESAIGAVFTSVNRSIDADGPVGALTSSAYAGGIDLRHRFSSGDYELTGYFLGSRIAGNAGAIDRVQRSSTHYFQRPDASYLEYDPTRTSLFGTAARVGLQKVGGGNWRWGLSGDVRSPGFDVNALGFQRRADRIGASASVGYETFQPSGIFRRWNLDLDAESQWTFGGDRTRTTVDLRGGFQLRNFWSGFGSIDVRADAVSPTGLRGGPALRTPGGFGTSFRIRSDSRKTVRFGLGGGLDWERGTGSGSLRVSPSIGLQPSSQLEVELEPSVSWNREDAQYVTQRAAGDDTHYVFGGLDQQTVSLTARLNYTFSPDLSLQLYAQPFVSAGRYADFARVAAPRAAAFDERFDAYTGAEIDRAADGGYVVDADGDGAADFDFSNPDFNVKQFRSNVVLRWQYMPGSTLFVVWSQDRSAFDRNGNLQVGQDLNDLFGAPSTNVFLIKFEHWLGF